MGVEPQSGVSRVALFDFDGTLTTRDTFLEFLSFAVGAAAVLGAAARGLPSLPRDTLRGGLNTGLKAALLRPLLMGRPLSALVEAGERFAGERIATCLRPAALRRLDWHRREGHRVVVASASLDVSLRAWCAREGLELVATGLEVEDGLCTGRMCPPNCHGAEKLRRVRVHLGGRRDALYLYAYGDSRGDLPMLRAADEGWFRGFDGPALPHPPGWQAQRWMTEGADRC